MGPQGIENNMKALSDVGIRVVAISIDKPEKTRVRQEGRKGPVSKEMLAVEVVKVELNERPVQRQWV